MKTHAAFLIKHFLLAAGIVFASVPAHAVSADPVDMDPNLQAKVAKERAKQTARGQSSQSGSSAKCGQVDIANEDGPKSAAQRVNPRDRTVIITGPVINAAKCR